MAHARPATEIRAGLPVLAFASAALCHGWIDGQPNPHDHSFWRVRFTPRTASSRWSQINHIQDAKAAAARRQRIPQFITMLARGEVVHAPRPGAADKAGA